MIVRKLTDDGLVEAWWFFLQYGLNGKVKWDGFGCLATFYNINKVVKFLDISTTIKAKNVYNVLFYGKIDLMFAIFLAEVPFMKYIEKYLPMNILKL